MSTFSWVMSLAIKAADLRRSLIVLCFVALAAVASSQAQVAVSISPTSATVPAGTTKQFTATVTGTSKKAVNWSVDGIRSGNSTVGTISGSGLYTAPSTPGTHTVTATSKSDPTKSASATVTVVPNVQVSISPTSASLAVNTTRQFTATVTGTTNTSVQWSVDGVTGGNSTVGTISTSGLYTAPATTGSHTVRATSNADPAKSASASVTVTTVAVSISPTSVSLAINSTQQFTATVTGTTNTAVTWSVDGVNGGNSTVGTISTSGLYTAPGSTGSHTVRATSNADPTKSASAAVTVNPSGIVVSISPTSASVPANTTKQFAATVTGTSNIGVQWYVDGVLGGAPSTGTITTSGLYTAPTTAGSHTVTITSNADPTKSASSAVTVTVITISISPTSVTVAGNATKQFAATVTGTTNTGVKWYVDGVLGGTASTGTITTSGLYTAPSASGAHTVTITSNADPSKSASSAVMVSGVGVGVGISPTSASLEPNATAQFTATVVGTSNTAVTWSVDGINGGSSTVGTISTSGLYTAPGTTGPHTVRATSNADPTKSASAAVTVSVASVAISISPTAIAVAVSTTAQFTATVTGTPNTGVTWAVDGVTGGNTTVGTISSGGLYTAPGATGSHTVKATSNADTTKSASATVTVTSTATQSVTADFGNHSSTAYPISAGILGAQYSNPISSTAINTIYNGGFRTLRMYGWLQSVYTTQTANWTLLDQYLGAIKNSNVGKTPGYRVILELSYTPPWLIPTISGCAQPGEANAYKVPPSNADINTWAGLAKTIVAHVDQNYPGLVTDYEIWNEPELGSFCVASGQSRLDKYLAIYAATAPLIRAQLQQDGQTARIGGPTIVSSNTTWITALVTNTSTAPYVDFVSYHKYPSGSSDIDPGCMQWDSYAKWDSSTNTCKPNSSGVTPLYNRIQSTSAGTGFLANYVSVASAVRAGNQPNPTQTKIYLDEYNDNWYFYQIPPAPQDCCRNSATYSPVLNGILMIDMLDSVYQGAHRVPDSLEYYSASNPPFCLLGDSGGFCGAGNYNTNYPQYYLYSLFGSPNYLNLSAGGNYMAVSVSPGATNSGLAATAFWSATRNSIVIVNPTGTSYGSVQVTASNPGFTVGHATEFLLNDTNKTISSFALSASPSVNVSVPAYSVVAITMTP